MASLATRTPPLPSRNVFRNNENPQNLPAKPRPKPLNLTPMLEHRPDTPRFHRDDNLLGAGGPSFVRNNNNKNNNNNSVGSKQLNNNRIMIGDKSNLNGKRTVTECIDLSNTTGGVSEPSSVPPAKKLKTVGVNNNLKNATTTRISVDSKGKAKESRAKKEKEREQLTAESVAWRQKYKKAFPSFVFYFDALDNSTEAALVKSVERLGASVDNFFSKKVTHVVTSRSVPPLLNTNKENFNSPSVPQIQQPRSKQPLTTFLDSVAGPSKLVKKASGRSPISYSLTDGQKLRPQYDQGLDKNPFIDSQDILSKAAEFGLKIWRLDKAQLVISRINSHSPTKVDNQRNLSLPSLLRDEQVYGTRERDPFVPRPDTHYFGAQSCYVLVEDSTGEHRPIVTKEYERPRKREDPSWPVLWGGVESRTAFYHYEGPPVVYEAKRNYTSLYEPPPEGEIQTKPIPFTTTAPTLHRSVSLNQIQRTQKNNIPFIMEGVHGKKSDKYIAASGNSQVITSNVASGTSTQSGAVRGNAHNRDPYCNRRLAALKQKTVAIGGLPGKLKRSASLDTGMSARAPVAREEPKKPGYCENCRVKYDDFKMHVVSRKHLKFARTASNWTELDALLARIDRPLEYPEPPSSPFYEEHDSGFCGSDEEIICAEFVAEDELF